MSITNLENVPHLIREHLFEDCVLSIDCFEQVGRLWIDLHQTSLYEGIDTELHHQQNQDVSLLHQTLEVHLEQVHQRIFCGHWAGWLNHRLSRLVINGYLPDHPPPQFIEEKTPPLAQHFEPCIDLLNTLNRIKDAHQDGQIPNTPEVCDLLLELLTRLQIEGVLLLLGQRQTTASYRSALGAPIDLMTLFQSAQALVHPQQKLTHVGRALDKHAVRSVDPWWGKPRGNGEEKSEYATQILCKILKEPAWWNVFHHYKQGVVFEVRESAGHGARWADRGSRFIGFLEPFDESLGGTPKRVGD